MVDWEQALQGEDVVISKAGIPLVRLVPYEEAPEPIKIGLMKGQIRIADDFNELSPEIEEMFNDYLPYLHNNPFDRMIIASAAESLIASAAESLIASAAESLIVVTANQIFTRYPIEVRLVP